MRNTKYILITALIVFSLSYISFGKDLKFWNQFKVLKSTRTDVEKILGKSTNEEGSIYETKNERIFVNYSSKNCVGDLFGWNVKKDVVLRLRVELKESIPLENTNLDFSQLKNVRFDNSTNLVDLVKGIRYILEEDNRIDEKFTIENDDKISRIIFAPSKNDLKLRCRGFPQYDLIRSEYYPNEQYFLSNQNNDLAHFSNLLIERKSQSVEDFIGYLFIYMKKGVTMRDAKKYVSTLRWNAYKKEKISEKLLQISFGGYREQSQIVYFLLHKEKPSPLANPEFPLVNKK